MNGAATPVGADGTWATTVEVSTADYVTPIEALYTQPDGTVLRQRQSVVHGPQLDQGQYSPDGVGLHFTNTGLANLGPVVGPGRGRVRHRFAPAGPEPPHRPEAHVPHLDVKGNAYEAGIGDVAVAASSTPTGVATDIDIKDLYVGVNLNITDNLAINMNCSLKLDIPTTAIHTTFDLRRPPRTPRRST